MCEFDTPLYIYYSHIIVFILCVITACLIVLRNRKHPANQNAFYFIMLLALWVANVFGQWTIHDVKLNIFLVKISVLFPVLIALFFLYFSYHFANIKIPFKRKLILAIPSFALAGLAFSPFNLQVFNTDDCYYAHTWFISFYTYFFELFYIILATKILLKYAKDPTNYFLIKHQVRILVGAIWFSIIWDIVYEEIDRITFFSESYVESTPFFIVGMLFFVSLIAFAIIKRDLFRFNTVLTTVFSIILWTLIFIGMFLFPLSIENMVLFALSYIFLMIVFWKI